MRALSLTVKTQGVGSEGAKFLIVFELYQVSTDEKMSYVDVHIMEKMDTWFHVYMMEHGGAIAWETFCLDVCRRYGNIRPMDIVIDLNRLQQWPDVESYFNMFEELCFY